MALAGNVTAADAIGARRAEWIAAVNALDADKYATLFTEDAAWLPPGMPAVVGRPAIRRWLDPFFARYEYRFSIADAQVRVAGDLAVEQGVFISDLTDRASGTGSTHRGRYVVLWRDEGDEWKIERYVDVSEFFPVP